MFYILMAFIGELGFMGLGVLSKRLRNKGVQTLSVLGLYGVLTPVWALLAAWFVFQGQTDIGIKYLVVLGAWICVCFTLNFGNTWLMRFQSLSDGSSYKFGFAVLWALIADLVFFQHEFSSIKVLALVLLFSGGTVLHFSRQKVVADALRMPLPKRLVIIMGLSLVEASTYFLFKLGAGMQVSDLFHNALSQALLFSIFFAMGWRSFQTDRAAGHVPAIYAIAMLTLMLVACVASGFAIAGLPLTLVVMFTLIRMSVFAVHDMKTGEIPASLKVIMSVIFIVCGFTIITLTGQGNGYGG